MAMSALRIERLWSLWRWGSFGQVELTEPNTGNQFVELDGDDLFRF